MDRQYIDNMKYILELESIGIFYYDRTAAGIWGGRKVPHLNSTYQYSTSEVARKMASIYYYFPNYRIIPVNINFEKLIIGKMISFGFKVTTASDNATASDDVTASDDAINSTEFACFYQYLLDKKYTIRPANSSYLTPPIVAESKYATVANSTEHTHSEVTISILDDSFTIKTNNVVKTPKTISLDVLSAGFTAFMKNFCQNNNDNNDNDNNGDLNSV